MASPAKDLYSDKGPLVIRSIYPCAGVATLAVIARFTSRKLKRLDWALDDYAVLVGLALTWGVVVSLHFCVVYGGGRHVETLSNTELVSFLKSIYALNEIYIATTPSIKVAALLMYRRIFITPRFRSLVHIILTLVAAWWLAEALAAVWLCIPVNGWWDRNVKAKCMVLRSFDLAFAIINITFDFVILLLPVSMVWRLQITNVQRVALTAVFLLGGLECIIAIVRLLSAILQIDNEDFSWVITNTLIWTAAECSVGVVSVCLPTLRPLLSVAFPRQFGNTGSTGLKESHPLEKTNTWRTDGSFARLQEPTSRIYPGMPALPKSDSIVHRDDSNAHPYEVEHEIRITTELEMHELNDSGPL